jgi:cation diffusion facilitator CzcD-associated flavoprotein CzcO
MDCASWQNIYTYLNKYADKFHLIDRIRFETEVLLIDKDDLKNANLPWIIKVKTAKGHYQTFEFDLVVVANGLCSTPEKPISCGQNKFSGSIVHATEIKRQDQFENKRVVIVGGAKSAVDMATLAAMYARSCYMVSPHSYWIIPHKILHGYIPLDYTFTRLFASVFDPFPYAPHGALFHFIHRTFSFMFIKLSESISNAIIAMYRSDLFADKKFIPKGSIRNAQNIMRVTKEFVTLI